MAAPDQDQKPPLHWAVLVGVAALCAGGLGWLWTGEWRWIVTGVFILILGAVVAGTTT
jgi:uncharacterized membrane protein YjjP (DUF1212 family)